MEYLIIQGFFDEKNNINVYPLYSVVDRRAGFPDNQGPYVIELQDATGKLLKSYRFRTDEMHITKSNGACVTQDSGMFYFGIPADAQAQKAIIKKDVKVLWSKTRSTNVPVVSIKTPIDKINNKIHIEWAASDIDDDVLCCFVEYSADGGFNWEPVSGLFPNQSEKWKWELDKDIWQPLQNSMIGISCTDGFNTTRSIVRIILTIK
ncbi:MAG TPA: hypothetical protein ACFYEF_03090 [Candidatus Wunengus sp. YC63]|uniref:hypothetical protein n=1 Tax=Candidatus Wunengus sp. YC63 TaxID=3367699 RepID=UPI004025D42B